MDRSAESLIRDEEEFDQFVREAEARQAAACFQHFFYEEPEVPGCSLTPPRLDRRHLIATSSLPHDRGGDPHSSLYTTL